MADDRVVVDLDIDDSKAKKKTGDFEKDAKNLGESAGAKFAKSFGLALVGLTAGIAVGLKKAVGAAIEQENALAKLNQSLASSGRFTREASLDMQNFASQLQSVTIVGDETTLGLLSLANNMARSTDEAKKMVSAALDLSAATGLSADNAIKNLGKTLAGLTGELGESVPELRSLTAEQLKAGLAIDVIAKKYDGFAKNEANTFSGAMKQSANSFGDFLEKVGDFITKNPVLISFLKSNNTLLQRMNEFIDDNKVAITAFVNGALHFMIDALIGTVFFLDAVTRGFQTLLGVVQAVSLPIQAAILPIKALFTSLDEEIQKFQGLTQIMQQNLAAFTDSGDGALENITLQLVEFKQAMLDAQTQATQSFPEIKNQIKEAVVESNDDLKSLNSTLRSVLVTGISSTIQGMVNAIAKGQNALKALGQSLLGIAGDLAISIGQFTIATGVAKLALESLPGGATIAAGIGLIALGSVLKAFAGGQPGVGGGGAPSINNPTPVQPVDVAPAATQEARTLVTVNVHGNILDRRETGLELAEIIRETVQTNAIDLGLA